jgi:hypothetical protein
MVCRLHDRRIHSLHFHSCDKPHRIHCPQPLAFREC